MDILGNLCANPGLAHVAEQIVSFLDNNSVASCRLVSKNYSEFLVNIWRDRTVKEANQQCENRFRYDKITNGKWRPVHASVFEFSQLIV